MSDLVVETHQHEISHIGFTEDRRVVITFHNDPFNGEVVLTPETFEAMYKQWKEFCAT